MASNALVRVVDDDGGRGELAITADGVRRLIEDVRSDELDDLRIKAEAQRVHEKLSGHAAEERKCAQLRLLAEAALGVLSFADPGVVPDANKRGDWRALAAAFERGKLVPLIEKQNNLTTTRITAAVRARGWASVAPHHLGIPKRVQAFPSVESTPEQSAIMPDTGLLRVGPMSRRIPIDRSYRYRDAEDSIPWAEARQYIRDKRLDPERLPADPAAIRRHKAKASNQSRRMHRAYHAEARVMTDERRSVAKRLAKEQGKEASAAYGYLRQAMQAVDEWRAVELPVGPDARLLVEVYEALKHAEQKIVAALGVR